MEPWKAAPPSAAAAGAAGSHTNAMAISTKGRSRAMPPTVPSNPRF